MKAHFRRATKVYVKTFPFVLLRLGIGLLLGAVSVLYFGVAFYVGYRLLEAGTISGWIAVAGLLAAVGLFGWLWRLFSRYVLYLVKAGHIAVIARAIETGDVPDDQLRYGTAQVTERFGEASALFAVDQVIKAVLKQFNRGVVSVSSLFSAVPALKTLVKLLGKSVAVAATYVDEAIIAYMFVSDESNPWRSARDGVVLYGKQWKPILASTMVIVFGLYAASFVLLLALTPIAGVLGGLSTTVELAGWIVVGGTFLTLYTGLLKPWIKTVVITTFLLESRDETPDSETMDRVAARSDRFETLVSKAGGDGTAGRSPAAETPPVGETGA
ncbi:hypothetical protein [Natronolimnohabitans innermongolicus]|uniref:Uncharacterized protein n=1 Tax=Natronolimnohabitans innermongolicus JCM 12255 TaxID=1227499 RepID=L9WID3_9EURY|nr:hypothetical protein [Natronolimnohabitans innermongolicus]ELY49209.1 hypothetical protein C493_20972 [Natronolimnohabitans innermongolicus JCM 12255]